MYLLQVKVLNFYFEEVLILAGMSVNVSQVVIKTPVSYILVEGLSYEVKLRPTILR